MKPSSPNIIWLISDQHRAQALSGMGDPNLQTPVIDRMIGASRSAIAGSPVCSPFRGSLLTSCYPHHCIPAHDDPRLLHITRQWPQSIQWTSPQFCHSHAHRKITPG